MIVLDYSDFSPTLDSTIAVEPRAPQPVFPEHTHNFHEVFLVERGTGVHVFNEVPHILRSGTVCFVRDSDRHLFENVDGLFLTNILYRSPRGFRFLSDITQFLPQYGDGEIVSHWQVNQRVLLQAKAFIDSLNREVRVGGEEAIATSEGQFLQLLILLRQGRFQPELDGSRDACIGAMLDWLQHNYFEEVDWHRLADRFSLAPRTLHRQMRERTGMTPQRYLNRLRLLEARRRLLQSDATITEIAFDCGFGDSNHFSTQFRREFSYSPKAMREMGRKAPNAAGPTDIQRH